MGAPTLSGASRAAVLLLTLGGEGATKLLKHFSAEEIRALRQSAALPNSVTPMELDEIVADFQDAFRVGPAITGLDGEMTKLLRSSLTREELALVFDGEAMPVDEGGVPVWQEIEQLGQEALAKVLDREHPQVAAYILQRVKSDFSATIVAGMPATRRNDIMRRMLSSAPPPEAVARLIERRCREAFVAASKGAERRERYATMAEIVNRMEKAQTEELLAALETAEPEEAAALRKLLFAFEDVAGLSRKGRLVLFDAIQVEQVTLALNGAPQDLREAVLSAMGARARRMVEAELGRNEPAAADAVQAARRAIAGAALSLAAEGRIDLAEKAEG
ncbi:FliG C-terminal domain-containing protein [Aureimonas flava]|uniref:FliG C-terminal domain-containing protein n=1 Tax=Aureimonas flava TaxID=2320271 RepID=UPI001459FEDF|nr:FliG C-terminal domain-containing protein [Aureimonas flava]